MVLDSNENWTWDYLSEHMLFLLVAADKDKSDNHTDKQRGGNANPQCRTTHSQLEEQHREAPADNRLEHHHERSVEAPEFAEGSSPGGKARHIELDEQQISQHMETSEPKTGLHRLVRTLAFRSGHSRFVNSFANPERINELARDLG